MLFLRHAELFVKPVSISQIVDCGRINSIVRHAHLLVLSN